MDENTAFTSMPNKDLNKESKSKASNGYSNSELKKCDCADGDKGLTELGGNSEGGQTERETNQKVVAIMTNTSLLLSNFT